MTEEKNKLKPMYIDDDYAEERTWIPDGFPELKIKYRPVTVKQAARIADKMLSDDKIVNSTQTNLELIKSNVIEWNITDRHGQIVDHTDMNKLNNLDPFIVREIINTIRGGDSAKDEEELKKIQESVKNS